MTTEHRPAANIHPHMNPHSAGHGYRMPAHRRTAGQMPPNATGHRAAVETLAEVCPEQWPIIARMFPEQADRAARMADRMANQ